MPKAKRFSPTKVGDYWYVCAYEDRKRVYLHPDPNAKRKSFDTGEEAAKAADLLTRRANATDYRQLSPVQRAEYWRLSAIAREHGLTLEDAVAKGCGRARSWPAKIWPASQDFLTWCEDVRRIEESSVKFYRYKFSRLFKDLPQATFGDFDGEGLSQLIKSKANGAEWEKGAVRSLSALWKWAAGQSPPLCDAAVVKAIRLEHAHAERSIDFFTVAELARMLAGMADGWSRNALALMAFTGMHKTEAEAMRWEWIDFENRVIHIPAKVAKSKSGHLIERAPDVLWGWLRRPAGQDEVCPSRLTYQTKLWAKAAAVPWIQNGLRHSFATYHYAAHRDANWTRDIMGHEENSRTLEKRYRSVSTTRAGKVYLPTVTRGKEYLALTEERCREIAA